jgi:dihydrofolate synthase/folylpolyglutamate synthase
VEVGEHAGGRYQSEPRAVAGAGSCFRTIRAMTMAPNDTDLAAYVQAVRGLLAHGGFELTGSPLQAKRWDVAHIRAYLDDHDRPDARPTVHVAGSKAKGSVATMIEALLRASLPAVPGAMGASPQHGAARTMLYTSPDLHAARERIAIDGQPLDASSFASVASRVLADPAAEGWSYFELLTVMAWLAAAERGCAWQVLEVGLGGRLDTTNAVQSKVVAVITPIDREHTAILGETIPEIAREKAGIITGPCDVVIAPQRASAVDVVREVAAAAGARVHEVTDDCAIRVTSQSLDRVEFDLRTPLQTYRKLRLELLGEHQAENAAAAIRAAELALATVDIALDSGAVHEALARVRLPGRGEIVRRRPLTIVDGAHTPLAARRLRQALDRCGVPRSRVFVLGLLEGKDAASIARELVGPDDQVFVAAPASPRAADPAAVAAAFRETGAVATTASDVPSAIERATLTAGDRGAVIVTGSLRTVSEARESLLAITGDHALGLR